MTDRNAAKEPRDLTEDDMRDLSRDIAITIMRSLREDGWSSPNEAAQKVRAEREAFLDSPNLDPAWIAGWHAATDHIAHRFSPGKPGSEDGQ